MHERRRPGPGREHRFTISPEVCSAEITITDVTGLNPNVLLEYGVRLSVRDSLNLLLCHRGVVLPIDIADQRYIEYTQEPSGVQKARDEIVRASLPMN